ncbi:MAG: fibronectin type III-like domain-contianing protein, partial [Bacteroidales bacterium]|nr:fibronectin type III-like domain-contianing protein [Bacteroidales bacterium]
AAGSSSFSSGMKSSVRGTKSESSSMLSIVESNSSLSARAEQPEYKEAVLLYSSDLVASLIPDVKRLRGFEKVALEPGETKTVEFELPASALAFVGADGKWRLEKGDFRISCGGLGVMVNCTETKVWETPNI